MACVSKTTQGKISLAPGIHWSQIFLFLLPQLTYSMVQSPSWEANWFAASQEIPRISRNPKVHYRTHKRPPTVSILGQPNPVHIPTSYPLEIHPNIIHPSTPRSPQWSPSLRFPHQDPIHPPLLTHTRHMPSPYHYSRVYHPHSIRSHTFYILSLSWTNPIQSIYPHPTSWRSSLILPTHLPLGLHSGLLPSGSPPRPYKPPLHTHTRHMPSPSHFSRFYHPHNTNCSCWIHSS